MPVIDVEMNDQGDLRRVTIDGRAHALVAVTTNGNVQAHLIGSGKHMSRGNWGDTNVPAMGTSLERELHRRLVDDLTSQIDPMPRLVARRIHPNAEDGTARALHAQAVFAEQEGQLLRARSLAQRARVLDPHPRYLNYLQELDRVIASAEPTD